MASDLKDAVPRDVYQARNVIADLLNAAARYERFGDEEARLSMEHARACLEAAFAPAPESASPAEPCGEQCPHGYTEPMRWRCGECSSAPGSASPPADAPLSDAEARRICADAGIDVEAATERLRRRMGASSCDGCGGWTEKPADPASGIILCGSCPASPPERGAEGCCRDTGSLCAACHRTLRAALASAEARADHYRGAAEVLVAAEEASQAMEAKLRAVTGEPSDGHDLADEVLGLLRVAQGQRDAAEARAEAAERARDESREVARAWKGAAEDYASARAELSAERAALSALREALREVEWVTRRNENGHQWSECPVCGREPKDGHDDDCTTARALLGGGDAARLFVQRCPACDSPEKWGDQHAPWCRGGDAGKGEGT